MPEIIKRKIEFDPRVARPFATLLYFFISIMYIIKEMRSVAMPTVNIT
tara:strand:- start:86 stop:229 length:144 start_codon:yes stop_codon:yes gene_type:complete